LLVAFIIHVLAHYRVAAAEIENFQRSPGILGVARDTPVLVVNSIDGVFFGNLLDVVPALEPVEGGRFLLSVPLVPIASVSVIWHTFKTIIQ
jgi:hypothetical protein